MSSFKYLYKYKPFSEFLLKELCEQEVYYCPPYRFNDPLDCKPLLRVDVDLSTLEKFAYQLLKKKNSENPERAISQLGEFRYSSTQFGKYDDGKEGEADYRRSLLQVIESDILEAIGDIGVLSLSRKWDSILMWSHYAGNHQGVCLEFEIEDNRCDDLRSVVYNKPRGISVKDFLSWRLYGDAEAEQRVRHGFVFTKARTWRYEAEWRAVHSPSGPSPSPFRLRSVLFGARCDSSLVTTLVKLFSGSEVNPHFYKVYLDNELTKLSRRRVNSGYIEAFGVRKSSIFRDEQLLAMLDDLDELEEGVSGSLDDGIR